MLTNPDSRRFPKVAFQLVCTLALVGSVLPAMISSLHWPLIGDSSLMHYVIFLQKQGLTSYKNIIDINLPGTYAFEAIAMRCFGQGALAWRLYDLALLVAMALAALVLAGKRNWFGGVFAGTLFALVHLQDGLEQGGQRNLLMAVLLLWSYVALFLAQKTSSRVMALLAGLGLGCTVTIKPTMLPLALALIGMTFWAARKNGHGPWKILGSGMSGLFLPSLAALGWLQQTGALPAFMRMFFELLPMHAQLGRQKLSFLMSHCFSPIAAIAVLWVLLCLLARFRFSIERAELVVGLFGTYLAYIAEGKGYPYQRYPFLAILLVMIGLDVSRALSSRGWTRNLALCTCIFSCFLLAPRYAWLTHTFNPQTPFQSELSADLLTIGMPSQLSGNVQCLDTFGGCINTLYDLRVRQSTGFLYDCYLFSGDETSKLRYRDAFWTSFQQNKPRVVVATNQFCFGDSRGFSKLDMWPRFASTLAQEYELRTAWKSPVYQHWWSRKEMPTEFRIYLRKAADSQ